MDYSYHQIARWEHTARNQSLPPIQDDFSVNTVLINKQRAFTLRLQVILAAAVNLVLRRS